MQQRANTLTVSCTKNGENTKYFKNLLIVDLDNDKVQLFEVYLLEFFIYCSYETPKQS